DWSSDVCSSDLAPSEREHRMKLLHLDSSALGANSVSRELSAAIVASWQARHPGLEVEYRDLDSEPLPHLTGASLAKADPAAVADAERVLEQFLAADRSEERRVGKECRARWPGSH